MAEYVAVVCDSRALVGMSPAERMHTPHQCGLFGGRSDFGILEVV